MSVAVVGAGSNLGAREAAIRGAAALLDARDQISVIDISPLYETPPLGPPQGDYLNAAFRVETALTPPELLRALLRTERRLGRKRSADLRWGPRSIDLDLLWDARGPHVAPGLQVPHPELDQRSFALGPLLDVAPELGDRYADALEAAGGRPPEWGHDAIVRQRESTTGVEREVEAESLADACALAASFDWPSVRPWSTLHLRMEAQPERFAEALRQLFRSGFQVCRTTISHCSQSQWNAEFHGVHRGSPLEVDVRLQTTSASMRHTGVNLVTTPKR